MRRTLVVMTTVAVLASVLAIGPANAGSAVIEIDQVGGRDVKAGEVKGKLFGKTLAEGIAIPSSAAPDAPAARPLVADAGDSPFVASGSTAVLLGAGFGGTDPYAFSWSTTAGTLEGADSATALVDATGVAPGIYTATLAITDGAGASDSDTVSFVVYEPVESTLLDETRADATPGVLGIGAPGTIEFEFTVPENTSRITLHVEWGVPTNDYDLRVLRPDGSEAISSGNAPGEFEDTAVSDPVPGTWTAAVDKFATLPDDVTVVVTGTGVPADPRPVVRSGGPYRFAVGAPQPIGGSVTGGAQPVSAGWDTDENGLLDVSGTSFTGGFGEGRRLITLKATDANGLERRETTSVLVASTARLAAETTAITVIALNDSGINPYHLEFSAQTYPDPDVLALTGSFTKHPSQYIPGFPADAQAIPITLGKGYFPVDDARGPDANGDGVPDGSIWDQKSGSAPWGLEFGKLYWIPGTKIVGAIQPGTLSCSNCAVGAHVILDDDGHGTGSSSVSAGNRYGYCPTCLIVLGKGLGSGTSTTTQYAWADINSNSWGTLANLPLDLGFQLIGSDPARATREAVERGQTVLFAAGNGAANAFDSPSPTYGTSTTGPDWNVVVGAIRRDNQRAIVGEGTPAHLSSWGDGNLPSACRTGTVSQCAFGGTSAATPYTAGVFGTVLTAIRRQIGDGAAGQRPGQVVAEGFPIAGSPYLSDGKLTRGELREAVLKTALPLNQDNAQQIPIYPYPLTAPYNGDINVLFEGYGAATPNSAKRAIDVLLGKMQLPVRAAEDRWFEIDRQVRDSLWGGHDRDGDGTSDPAAPLGAFGLGVADVETTEALLVSLAKITNATSLDSLTQQQTGANAHTYWLHRSSEGEPQVADSCANGVTYMDQSDSAGDHEPCFTNRATSVLAAFRPLGMWPTVTDADFAIPAGSNVTIDLWIASDQVTVARPSGVLMATDRVLGEGAGTPTPLIGSGPWISQGSPVVVSPLPAGVTIDQNMCEELGESCWNRLSWSFDTTRHAIAGEQLTFQVALIGVRAWSFGYEGQHRSKITITPAPIPAELDHGVTITEPAEGAKVPDQTPFTASGFASFPALGTTEAGDHPAAKRVDVSVDDPTFANAIEATLTLNADETAGSWSAPIPGLAPGSHTIYAKARLGDIDSPVTHRTFTALDIKTTPRVQWQIVPDGASPSADGWTSATGVLEYSFQFDTRAYGSGSFDIYTRLLEGGAQTAITSVRARFR